MKFIAWLREATSEATDVVWRANIDVDLDVPLLYHLPPPAAADGPAEVLARVEAWRDAHRPAMCYYRVGPGFIQVRDVRVPQRAATLQLDEQALIDAFTCCLQHRRLRSLTPDQQTAATRLRDEGLLIEVDGWVTTLPSRMRKWPVPSYLT